MGSLLYFLPRVNLGAAAPGGKLSRSLLESRGLLASFADCASLDDAARCEVIGKGPDGGPGLILSPLPLATREPPRRLGYFADDANQQWTRVSELLWVGLDAVCPPTPLDLARRAKFRSHPILMGDGQEWQVPALQLPGSDVTTLPRDMFWDEAGNFTMQLRPDYAEIWARTRRFDDYFYRPAAPGFRSIMLAEALPIILDVLGLQYRVGRIEQRVLHLVTTDNCEAVMGAIVDYPGFEAAVREIDAAQKKSGDRSLSPSSTPGGAAATGDTGQPAANCTLPNECP